MGSRAGNGRRDDWIVPALVYMVDKTGLLRIQFGKKPLLLSHLAVHTSRTGPSLQFPKIGQRSAYLEHSFPLKLRRKKKKFLLLPCSFFTPCPRAARPPPTFHLVSTLFLCLRSKPAPPCAFVHSLLPMGHRKRQGCKRLNRHHSLGLT